MTVITVLTAIHQMVRANVCPVGVVRSATHRVLKDTLASIAANDAAALKECSVNRQMENVNVHRDTMERIVTCVGYSKSFVHLISIRINVAMVISPIRKISFETSNLVEDLEMTNSNLACLCKNRTVVGMMHRVLEMDSRIVVKRLKINFFSISLIFSVITRRYFRMRGRLFW